MMPDSPPDEVLFVQEQVEQLGATSTRQPGQVQPSRGRAVWLALGGVALGLAGATMALRLVRDRPRTNGRRRGLLLNLQPRIQPRTAVFAPTLTVSLPFSSIAGQRQRRPNRTGAGRAGPFSRWRPAVERGGRARQRQVRRRLAWSRP